MKRILMLALAAALSMSVSACQDSTNPSSVLSGTYTLRTVNGQTPPVPIQADPINGTTEIVGGYIQIDRNGTFTDVLTYRTTPSGGVPGQPYDDTINGTWALSGNSLEFTDVTDPGNPYYATVSGNQLLFTNYASGQQYTVVYSK
jgi:opacity protein-like surface antigen